MSVVEILGKMTSKSKLVMIFVRLLVFDLMKYNILIKVFHIAGFRNVTADRLSRNLLQVARKGNPMLEWNPTHIPSYILPHNWI